MYGRWLHIQPEPGAYMVWIGLPAAPHPNHTCPLTAFPRPFPAPIRPSPITETLLHIGRRSTDVDPQHADMVLKQKHARIPAARYTMRAVKRDAQRRARA